MQGHSNKPPQRRSAPELRAPQRRVVLQPRGEPSFRRLERNATMKVRINKKLLADMPEGVRRLVEEWRGKWRKSFICVTNVDKFAPGEDAKVTVFNLATGVSQTERV